jgi:ubiquinol-cytochrome c reductase iron-sulfur subunit
MSESTPSVEPEDASRRDFIHIAAVAATVGAGAAVLWPLIDQMNPSSDTLALSSIEVDYSKVALGQMAVVKWRSQPVGIWHRTPAQIAAAVADDHADLRDPATDASRHKPGMAEWLIVIDVCTHLGCIPTFGEGPYRGWLCPCHGSQYDTSGRIRAGPAPKNLYLPPYTFEAGNKVKIG